MKGLINEYGVKTSKKLESIMLKARVFIYGGKKGYSSSKYETKTYQDLQRRFEKEAFLIGGVDYSLGDSLA